MRNYRQRADRLIAAFLRRRTAAHPEPAAARRALSESLAERSMELWRDKRWCVSDAARDAIIAVLVEHAADKAAQEPAGWWKKRQARQLNHKIGELRDYLTRFSAIWSSATGEDEMFFPLGYSQECIARAMETYERGIRLAVDPAETAQECIEREARGVPPSGHMLILICWAAISLAGELTRRAMTLTTWQSAALDDHGLRVNLDDQLAGLTRQLRESAALYHELGAPPTENRTPEDRYLLDLHRRGTDAVNGAAISATDRLIALQTYVDRLSEIDRIDAAIRRADEIEVLDNRIENLVGASGADELGEGALVRAADGVGDMRKALSAAWAQLRGDFNAMVSAGT